MPFRGSKSETGWGPISRHRSSVRHVTPVQCVTGDRTGQTPRPGRSTKYECTSTLGVRERQTRCCSQIKPNVSQVMIPGNISPKCVLLPPGSPFYFLRFSRYEQASTAMASVRGRCCLCNRTNVVAVVPSMALPVSSFPRGVNARATEHNTADAGCRVDQRTFLLIKDRQGPRSRR
jgi:hypothetical protein